MNRIFVFILSNLLFLSALADEGMWLMTTLNKMNMDSIGCKLSPQQIYSVNKSSVKDAIVGLGSEGRPFRFFCSAEIVSSKGLLFTNHHCAYNYIQKHSSVDHNYLKEGYWAKELKDELPNEGLTASIVVSVTDVTKRVVSNISSEMSRYTRDKIIDSVCTRIEQQVEDSTEYAASVVDYFDNNQFFLYQYIIYKDVRLVGAPPEFIGKFGGVTDNWEWPRHTGDFTVLRIYTDTLGKPASYSEDNIPLNPIHYFPINISGVKQNDFAMILGFPGSTERHHTSFEVENIYSISNTERFAIRQLKLDIMKKHMLQGEDVNIKYAYKYSKFSNYWKYYQGQNEGIESLDVIEKKKKAQARIKEEFNDSLQHVFDSVLRVIEEAELRLRDYYFAQSYFKDAFIYGADIEFFPYYFQTFVKKLKEYPDSTSLIEFEASKLEKRIDTYYKDYSKELDMELLTTMLELVDNKVEQRYKPDIYDVIERKYKSNYLRYSHDVFKKSIFSTKERLLKFMQNPKVETIENDMAYVLMNSFLEQYRQNRADFKPEREMISEARQIYSQIILNHFSDSLFYPDANSTLRYTYGRIDGYKPRDAVYYKYRTTTEGILQKQDSKSYEFAIDSTLFKLLHDHDFGRYADNDTLPVCFISDNDITGGNSGSGVINDAGELIGIAFDGNWEAMSGDIIYEPELQRCINVDIRYVLFVIDKYAGAQRLIDELTIVGAKDKE